MEDQSTSANPRLGLLRREVEQTVLKPLRSHGWSADIVREVDHHDCIEIAAKRGAVATRIAVLYSSSGISNASYRELSHKVDRIFFSGQPYMLDSFARGVAVPVEPLGDFFPFLVDLNKQVEPDRSPPTTTRRTTTVRRLTAENPRGGHRTPATVHEREAGCQIGGEAGRNERHHTAARSNRGKGDRRRLFDAWRSRLRGLDTARYTQQEGPRPLLRHDGPCSGGDVGLALGTD